MTTSHEQCRPVIMTIQQTIDEPSIVSNTFNTLNNTGLSPSMSIDPHTKWYSATLGSIYDVPRQSAQYAPVPFASTASHRNTSIQHDVALEKRLLNAGLSPETVALYERILHVADRHPQTGLSSAKIVHPYLIRS
jgi:hypothetical protein